MSEFLTFVRWTSEVVVDFGCQSVCAPSWKKEGLSSWTEDGLREASRSPSFTSWVRRSPVSAFLTLTNDAGKDEAKKHAPDAVSSLAEAFVSSAGDCGVDFWADPISTAYYGKGCCRDFATDVLAKGLSDRSVFEYVVSKSSHYGSVSSSFPSMAKGVPPLVFLSMCENVACSDWDSWFRCWSREKSFGEMEVRDLMKFCAYGEIMISAAFNKTVSIAQLSALNDLGDYATLGRMIPYIYGEDQVKGWLGTLSTEEGERVLSCLVSARDVRKPSLISDVELSLFGDRPSGRIFKGM